MQSATDYTKRPITMSEVIRTIPDGEWYVTIDAVETIRWFALYERNGVNDKLLARYPFDEESLLLALRHRELGRG